MNLLGYDEEEENDGGNKKSRKVVLFSIIGCTILLVILLLLIVYISYLDSKKLKVYIDDKQIKISNTLFRYGNDGQIEYVSIKELASMVGYTYFNGEYGAYTEEKNSCYIQNDNESVSFVADSNVMKKYINPSIVEGDTTKKETSSSSTTKNTVTNTPSIEIFDIDSEVKLYDEILYLPWDLASKSFNIYIVRDGMKVKIYTLQTMATVYDNKAKQLGYDGISTEFKNVRALINNMLIVVKDGQYGVLDISKNFDVIVGKKYDNLEYIQNTQEFIVTANGNVGLLSSTGQTKITPNSKYTSIELLDVQKDLYIVKQNEKYGVLNGDGKAIVPADFDKIGINNTNAIGVNNSKLLFNNLIPVEKDGKWGFYDITGNYKLKASYEQIGYKKQESDEASVKDTIVIPKELGVEGIIISLDGRYGVIDTEGKIIIACACSKIYASTSLGETTYYYEIGRTKANLEELISQNVNTNQDNTNNNHTEENGNSGNSGATNTVDNQNTVQN